MEIAAASVARRKDRRELAMLAYDGYFLHRSNHRGHRSPGVR